MARYTKEDIIRLVEEEDIEFIRLQFMDIFNNIKSIALTTSQLSRVLANKCIFDGSSIEGLVRVEESDMFLYPDLDTFEIVPWRPQRGKEARFICNVYRPDGIPFEGDPRYILQKVLQEAKEMGYQFTIGPECEFFLFNLEENDLPTTNTHEAGSYFDVAPLDSGENARREMILALEAMHCVVVASHHEISPAQHEISLDYKEPLQTADNIVTFKMAVKTIARRHGLHASFMPKPRNDVNGSGMHINISLWKDGKNLFSEPEAKAGLSQDALYFIGGLIRHMEAMTLITNPLVNSYKRLVPGFDAPAFVAWSESNRSPLIRIPAVRGDDTRMELRYPDPASNPYLALAVCLAAGLDGIKQKIQAPDSVDKNLFHLSEEELASLHIKRLPLTLKEAVDCFKQDLFLQELLGSHISGKYIEAKMKEWNDYNLQITEWELSQYLYKI